MKTNKLIEGIHHFQQDTFGSMEEMFERLARSQSPDALFITCSDSRIVPNLLTNTEPGDLFLLRNAGNIIPPHGAANGGEAATIEYAVAALGIEEIIVCGHSNCGAMKALLEPDSVKDLPAVADWLRHAETTQRIIRENYSHLKGDALLKAAIAENVLVQLEHLRTLPSVATRLLRGDLHLHGWVYEIETGEVFTYDPALGQFVAVSKAATDAVQDGQEPAFAVKRPALRGGMGI